MRHTLTLGALAASAALLALPAVTQASTASQRSASVRIVGVQYHSRQSGSSLNQQWFQLKNTGQAMQMRGWTVSNGRGNVYHFGRYVFADNGYLRVHTGRGHNTTRDFYWGRNASAWNYHGDTITLRSASGTIVQRFHYSGGGSDAWCDGYQDDWGPWGNGGSGNWGP